jgi:hypothetical protein
MKKHPRTKAPRAPRTLRLAIWALAVALGAAAWNGSTLHQDAEIRREAAASQASGYAVHASAAAVSRAPAAPVPARTDSTACSVTSTEIPAGTEWTLNDARERCINLLVQKYCPTNKKCNPDHFLPMERWRSRLDTLLVTNTGWFSGVSTSIQSSIGGLFMSLAILMWSLISTLAGLSASFSLLTGAAGERINDTFLLLSNGITQSGLVALVVFLMIVTVIRQVLRSRGGASTGVFSTVLTLVLPLALLSILTAGAQSAETNGEASTSGGTPTKFSPVWLASRGQEIAAIPATALGEAIDYSRDEAYGSDRYASPSCNAYTRVLMESYSRSWDKKHNGSTDLPLMLSVNMLWNEAFLTFYSNGQFQNTYSGSRITCHILDGSEVSAAEQAVVAAAAGYPAGRNAGSVVNAFKNPGTATAALSDKNDFRVFSPYFSMDADFHSFNKRAYLMHWGACVYKGGNAVDLGSWYIDPGWGSYDNNLRCNEWWTANHSEFTEGGDSNSTGHKYENRLSFEGKSAEKLLAIGSANDRLARYEAAITQQGSCTLTENKHTCLPGIVNGKPVNRESLNGAAKTIATTASGQVGGWIFSGLMALLTSLLYLYVLGGLFAGLMIAKIGFGLLVALLPGILLLAAIPSKQGRSSASGMKMLRTLIGWMATTAVTSVMITVFVLVISVIRSLLSSDGSGFMYIVSPIVAMYFLHFLMKTLGMGSLVSMNPGSTLAASSGLALGAAKAASSGRMGDLRKGGQSTRKVMDAGKKWQGERYKKKNRREQVRNKARKAGMSYKDLKKNDDAFARWDASSSFAESLAFKRAARKGKKDHEGQTRRVKAERGQTLGKRAKRNAANAIQDAKRTVGDADYAARGTDTNSERENRKSKLSRDKKDKIDKLAATDKKANARLNDLAANADLAADKAPSLSEAADRELAGQKAAADVASKASHADSKGLAADRAASLEKDPKSYRDTMERERVAALGLDGVVATDDRGKAFQVMGFELGDGSGGSIGSVAPHSSEFDAVSREAQRLAASGALSDTIVMPAGSPYAGRSYVMSGSMQSIGAEGRAAAQSTYAAEMGVLPTDVITSRSGTMVAVAPASGDRAYTGTRLTVAATPDDQVKVARGVLQHLPPNVAESVSKLPPEGQRAALEVIATHFSEGGQQADALEMMNIREDDVRTAHAAGPDAMRDLFEGRHIPVPPALHRAALAEGYRQKSLVTSSSTMISTLNHTANVASQSLNTADDIMGRVAPIMSNPVPSEDPRTQQKCFDDMVRVYEHIGVVEAAALVCNATASGAQNVDSSVIAETAELSAAEVASFRTEFAAAGPDVQKRAAVLQRMYKEVATNQRNAERNAAASIERVAESTDLRSRASSSVGRRVRGRVNPRLQVNWNSSKAV